VVVVVPVRIHVRNDSTTTVIHKGDLTKVGCDVIANKRLANEIVYIDSPSFGHSVCREY